LKYLDLLLHLSHYSSSILFLNNLLGHVSEQGKRKSMEDAVVHFDDFNSICPFLSPSTARGLWAVYDGHGGAEGITIQIEFILKR
jgi:serine/threonine protein phosphatase PrpC